MGGRGADYNIPSNGGGENFSNGVGTKVADNVKEALGKKR